MNLESTLIALKQRLRNLIFQILHRIPHVEVLRPHTDSLMKLLLVLLRTENEENAILCLKIIIDLHRSFSKPSASAVSGSAPPSGESPTKSGIEASVDEFLRIMEEIFEGMKDVVRDTFASNGTTPAAESTEVAQSPAAGVDGLDGPAATPVGGMLPLGMKSFKLLQDCPAAIVFMFQTYRNLVEHTMEVFIPLVFNVSHP